MKSTSKNKNAVIIGAGITGLRLAKYLVDSGYKVTILEKSKNIGGVTGSFEYRDFILDYGPHKFYTQLENVQEDFEKILGKDNFLKVKKKNSIRLLGKYFDFPVKITQLLLGINPILAIKIMLDLIRAKLDKRYSGKVSKNYEEYFIKGFGKTGYSILFKGFAEKVWGDPKKLAEELARKRSPASSIFEVLKTAIVKNEKNVSAEYFYYPKKGFGEICNNLSKDIKSKGVNIITEANLKKVIVKNNKVSLIEFIYRGKNKKLECDTFISSMPIDLLPAILKPLPNSEILDSAKKLKFRAVLICYVFLNKTRALKDNWIFFPEKEFFFNRVAEQKSFSQFIGPKNKTVLTAEVTCNYGDSVFNLPNDKLKKRVIADLEKAGLIKEKEVYDFFTLRANKVYPVYELNYKKYLNTILGYLDSIENLYSVGRPGLFNYNNSDHSLDMARIASNIIINNKPRVEWKRARDYFDSYRIVD
jgi:protoporphyrinogen oxidase